MSRTAISGWPALLLTPFAFAFALVAGLFSRAAARSPAEVAGFIACFLEGTGAEWDWDEFESVPIRDPRLDAIRQRAGRLGPPNADLDGLRALLSELREEFPEAR